MALPRGWGSYDAIAIASPSRQVMKRSAAPTGLNDYRHRVLAALPGSAAPGHPELSSVAATPAT